MAHAIARTLDAPPDPRQLKMTAERFSIGRAVDAYEALLAPEPRPL